MSLQARLTAFVGAVGQDIKALLDRSLPAGGAAGQVLVKTAPGDFETGWASPPVSSKLLQVLSVTKKDMFSTTSSAHVDVPGLAITITPSSLDSKIFIMASVPCGSNPATKLHYLRLEKTGDSLFAVGDAAGVRGRDTAVGRSVYDTNSAVTHAFHYLDSPGVVTPISYKITAAIEAGGTLRINAPGSDIDHAVAGYRLISTITVFEIAA